MKAEVLKPLMLSLTAELKISEQEADDVSKTIELLRKRCPHDWQSHGHGHKDEQFICTICGVTKWQ